MQCISLRGSLCLHHCHCKAAYLTFYLHAYTIFSHVCHVQVRAIVPKINLDDVFTAKTEIAADVKETLTKSMTSFGFEIIQTLVGCPRPACIRLCRFPMVASMHGWGCQ